MRSFNIKNDWKYINWKVTLITNIYRSIAAGVVWFLYGVLMVAIQHGQIPLWYPLLMLVGFPICYLVVFLPMGLLFSLLSKIGVPYVGLLSVISSLFVVMGDPILWFFDKITKNQVVPMKDLGFINFAIIFFVIDEDRKVATSLAS